MIRDAKRNNSVKYGVCTNMESKPDGTMCSLCQKKEKQAIRITKDFVCAECGTPLTEVTPPRSFPTRLLIIILSIVLVVAVLMGILKQKRPIDPPIPNPGSDDSIILVHDTITDTIVKEVPGDDPIIRVVHDTITDTIVKEVPGRKKSQTGKYNLGWGTYYGEMKNGKPADGIWGEIKIIQEYTLDLNDGRGNTLMLHRDDVIVNPKFKNGKFMLQGELHRKDGTRRVL